MRKMLGRIGEWCVTHPAPTIAGVVSIVAIVGVVGALRLSPAVRGYRMSEVDWLLDQFAEILDQRDAELAELRGTAHPPAGAGPKHSMGPDAGDDDHEESPHA